jgi:hypothetical protein
MHIKLKIMDQLPVSLNKEINVSTEKTIGAEVDKKGEVTWDLELEPGEKESVELGYTVKYPSYMNVIVE